MTYGCQPAARGGMTSGPYSTAAGVETVAV
jgi:hypothetical protein